MMDRQSATKQLPSTSCERFHRNIGQKFSAEFIIIITQSSIKCASSVKHCSSITNLVFHLSSITSQFHRVSFTVMTTENRPGFLGFAPVGWVFISAKPKGYHLKALPKGFQMEHWNPTSASTRPHQRPKTWKNGPPKSGAGAKASWPLKTNYGPKVA